MRALICYDTKYGSTPEICRAIRAGIKMDTDIRNVRDVYTLEYDLILIGSPIFIGKPMESVVNFIRKSYMLLHSRTIATFVTCWATATQYSASSRAFLEQLAKHLPPCRLIAQKALPGRLLPDTVSSRDKRTLNRLLRRLDTMADDFESSSIPWRDARDYAAAEAFGREAETRFRKTMQKGDGADAYKL